MASGHGVGFGSSERAVGAAAAMTMAAAAAVTRVAGAAVMAVS